MILAARIQEMAQGCLFTDEELAKGEHERAVVVRGLEYSFAFHPKRLEACRADVQSLIRIIVSDEFLEEKGGMGQSLVHLQITRENDLWGNPELVESFVCLAIGLGLCSYCAAPSYWHHYRMGIPYVVFHAQKKTLEAARELAQDSA